MSNFKELCDTSCFSVFLKVNCRMFTHFWVKWLFCCQRAKHEAVPSVGRPLRTIVLGEKRLRMRRSRKYSFRIRGRTYKVPNLRRNLLIYIKERWVPLKIKGRRREVYYGGRWHPLHRFGRHWKMSIRGRVITVSRLRLKLRYKRRQIRIVRRRSKWRLFIAKKWRAVICNIRRYVRFKGRWLWLKRRKGMWRVKVGRRWRRIPRPIRCKYAICE